MKNSVYIFSFIIFCISCNNNFSPLSDFHEDYEVLIQSIGNSQDGFIEFKFSNTTDETLLYWGYSKHSHLYLIQIMTDSDWAYHGGWCGTGAGFVQFDPHESFNVDVHNPSSDKPWRVGLETVRKANEDREYSWSSVQY